MNQVTVEGNLTADAKHEVLQSGQQVTKFRIASNDKRKGKNGEQDQEDVWFVGVEVWGQPAGWVAGLKKGEEVIVVGSMRTDTWKDQQQQTRSMDVLRAIRCKATRRLDQQQAPQQGYPQGGPGYGAPQAPPQGQYQPPPGYPPQQGYPQQQAPGYGAPPPQQPPQGYPPAPAPQPAYAGAPQQPAYGPPPGAYGAPPRGPAQPPALFGDQH